MKLALSVFIVFMSLGAAPASSEAATAVHMNLVCRWGQAGELAGATGSSAGNACEALKESCTAGGGTVANPPGCMTDKQCHDGGWCPVIAGGGPPIGMDRVYKSLEFIGIEDVCRRLAGPAPSWVTPEPGYIAYRMSCNTFPISY